MTFLITSDLHLTDRPKDAYRFDLFPWLVKQQKKFKPMATFILGDLTEFKDNHSAELVNKIVDSICSLEPPIFILKGNHDYHADSTNPFFRFLNEIPNIYFFNEPRTIKFGVTKVLMLPHVKHERDWLKVVEEGTKAHVVLLHQAVEGALSESGAVLPGLKTAILAPLGAKRILAGDIHRPQNVGPVTYVGAPYAIRFGDDFVPRVMLFDEITFKGKNLHFKTIAKRSLKLAELDEFPNDLNPGDQVKIEMILPKDEIPQWPHYRQKLKQLCEVAGVEIFGMELRKRQTKKRVRLNKEEKAGLKNNDEALTSFCKQERLPQYTRQVGKDLLKA